MSTFNQIEVPEAYFQSLVETATVAFLEEIYGISFGGSHASIPQAILGFIETQKQAYPEDPAVSLMHFIRVMFNDFVRSEQEMLKDETYQLIDSAVDAIAKQRVYEMIGVDGVLIQEANRYFDELDTYRQHNKSSATR